MNPNKTAVPPPSAMRVTGVGQRRCVRHAVANRHIDALSFVTADRTVDGANTNDSPIADPDARTHEAATHACAREVALLHRGCTGRTRQLLGEVVDSAAQHCERNPHDQCADEKVNDATPVHGRRLLEMAAWQMIRSDTFQQPDGNGKAKSAWFVYSASTRQSTMLAALSEEASRDRPSGWPQ